MSSLLKVLTPLVMAMTVLSVRAQHVKGKIIDAVTKEPVPSATVRCTSDGCACGCAAKLNGEFDLVAKENCCHSFAVSSIGYQPVILQKEQLSTLVTLQPSNSVMETIVVSANRETIKRSLAPVAISVVSSKMIQDAKPITIDQMLNKVSGVYMVNLGNEQHSMSIRQPMATKSLYLYLEDGIPIRTTGLFNHNALLEVNMSAVKNIEVIKGPSSSLYGSEAIGGVVNFITVAPTAIPVAKLSLQGNDIGYKRVDMQTAYSTGKWGFAVNGYYADKRNSFIEYTDFHKSTITARVDYRFSDKTSLANSFTWMDYYSDMTGGIDSTRFADHSFGSAYNFTYRKVKSLRYRSTLTQNWNDRSKTTASLVYRDNSVGQNPAYSIKDDYRRLSVGGWIGNKELAHGEINEVSFRSYALIMQHRQNFSWKNAALIGGLSADISPSEYVADYIRVKKDTLAKKYSSYENSDSVLTSYTSDINNYAAFLNFEFSPVEKLRFVATLRYDIFHYDFDNNLTPSSFSGSPDTVNRFSRISPKIGFTYNFSERTGIYANYSQGFVPPQVTEMYRGVKVPVLNSSVFNNYEIGGWAELVRNVLSADISLYHLDGINEIVSVRMDDGSTENRNAGKTSHKGIEIGVNVNPLKSISLRFGGAYSEHRFIEFVEKGTAYSGNEMNGAPRWIHNAEIWYRPSFIAGLRLGLEWQKIGSYYLDPLNTTKHDGYDVLNIRAGYRFRAMEVWINLMNATDKYYAYTASKSSFGYSYTPAEPRNFNIGLSYDFADLLKRK
jgi:outer membrane receptor protein involved in Fe transport